MRRFIFTALVAAACAPGCAARYSDGYGGTDLVYAAPGVQVVPDGDDPVFYSASFYWRFDGGSWYRSRDEGAWEVGTPPIAVSRLDRPQFVHYRPEGWAASHPQRQPQRQPQPAVVRDHRDDARAPGRELATPHAPAPRPEAPRAETPRRVETPRATAPRATAPIARPTARDHHQPKAE